MSRTWIIGLCAIVCSAGLPATVQSADTVIIETVTVGDPGNTPDVYGDGYGNVPYTYSIGKYEVTNGQYRAFLNAVAATGDLGEQHGLYKADMGGQRGGISRSGLGTLANPFVYTSKDGNPAWDNKPVNYVSWYDALRFANWLHNGQPVGTQDATTTEDGAYDMAMGHAVVRSPLARVWLPSEDEWYKAAYYKGGSPNAGYWLYAAQNDTPPTGGPPPGDANSANWYGIGWPYSYYTTAVGAYEFSASTYGTLDQNGNVAEWNEAPVWVGTPPSTLYRGRRGGSWDVGFYEGAASKREESDPYLEQDNIGFRASSLFSVGSIAQAW